MCAACTRAQVQCPAPKGEEREIRKRLPGFPFLCILDKLHFQLPQVCIYPVQDSNSVLSSGCKACTDPFRNHCPHPTQPFHEVSLVNTLTILKPQLSRELSRRPLLSNNSASAQPDTSHPSMLGKCGDFHINPRNAK